MATVDVSSVGFGTPPIVQVARCRFGFGTAVNQTRVQVAGARCSFGPAPTARSHVHVAGVRFYFPSGSAVPGRSVLYYWDNDAGTLLPLPNPHRWDAASGQLIPT